jgi:hypothetical protein
MTPLWTCDPYASAGRTSTVRRDGRTGHAGNGSSAGGKILAIDRSATMVRLATQRNADNIAAGKAVFRATALSAAGLEGVWRANASTRYLPST